MLKSTYIYRSYSEEFKQKYVIYAIPIAFAKIIRIISKISYSISMAISNWETENVDKAIKDKCEIKWKFTALSINIYIYIYI